jgi:hypothetical protein
MITSEKFDLIQYRKPDFKQKNSIPFLKGIDTEAYTTGKPFLCCTEDNQILDLTNFPECFFENDSLYNQHYVSFNLKYDSGAIIYFLSDENLISLWKEGELNLLYNNKKYKISQIPKKLLKLQQGKRYIYIWDILQFYKMSLDNAAKKYLNSQKIEVGTKSFTEEYVSKNYIELVKYCVHDALLASRLGNFLIEKLKSFNMKTDKLYSGATISLSYYSKKSRICTVWRYWKEYPELLKMVLDTYQGGKFEITQRGYFKDIYEYDISSAYPYEISNLYDISIAKVEKNKKYQSTATYGFLHILIDNSEGLFLPCGIGDKVRIYPAGVYEMHCTKAEYEYMTKTLNLDIKILDAYWLYLDLLIQPYKKTTEEIFKLKKSFKNKDEMLYNLTKVIANSFYGKTVQIIENNKGEFIAGSGWNPIHGTIITSNTRLQVTKIQNEYRDDCIAVHTDSVMIKRELDKKYITGNLGGMEYVTKGECILIACGMYELNDLSAFKGFEPESEIIEDVKHYETWKKILSKNKDKEIIKYPVKRVKSWIECCSQNRLKDRQKFLSIEKEIDLNCDKKRIWGKNFTGKDFLCKNEKSLPLIVIN